MTWVGSWRNQYSSVLEITSEANGRIEGSFRTDSLYGQQPAIVGVHQRDLISFAVGGGGPHGPLRDGRIETLWHLVASEKLIAEAEGAPAKRSRLIGHFRTYHLKKAVRR